MIHHFSGFIAGAGTLACAAHLWRARGWSAQRIVASQLALLRRQILGAGSRVPHYRAAFDALELKGMKFESLHDLRRLPFVTKETVKACFPDQLVADGLSWKSLYSMSTSGTHDRVMLFHDETKRGWDRRRMWCWS